MCITNGHVNYDFILSKCLNSPDLYINCANMWYLIIKIKNSFCACSISFKGFHLCIKRAIMWYSDNELRKKFNLWMLLQPNKNILCKNQIGIQNMYSQFKYEELHISPDATEIKLLKFLQLIIYKSLLSCQLQCIKYKPHVKTLFLEESLI